MGGSRRAELAAATKDAPFVNSLGMKFVPVPGTNILMCTTETTVEQYKASGMMYKAPTFRQGSNHPAVNMRWKEAQDWCAWLSKCEGLKYRLPTDAEWSAAVGGTKFPWGNCWPPPNHFGNYIGQEAKVPEMERHMRNRWGDWPPFDLSSMGFIEGFRDRHVFTAPVGSYPPNALGIHDLGGNVWEWCEDWYRAGMNDYAKEPSLIQLLGDRQGRRIYRVFRGGAWYPSTGDDQLSAFRNFELPTIGDDDRGFRCVLVVPSARRPPSALRRHPFL